MALTGAAGFNGPTLAGVLESEVGFITFCSSEKGMGFDLTLACSAELVRALKFEVLVIDGNFSLAIAGKCTSLS